MNRIPRIVLGTVGAAMLTCATRIGGAQSSVPNQAKGPTVFYPDHENEGFDGSCPPSEDVLDVLLKTREAHEMSTELMKFDREGLRKLFEVVRVNLANSAEEDDVVHGHSPMNGADNDWFWIVRRTSRHTQVILFAGGYSLELLPGRTRSYKNIRTVWFGPDYSITNFYHFDGLRYKLARKLTTMAKATP